MVFSELAFSFTFQVSYVLLFLEEKFVTKGVIDLYYSVARNTADSAPNGLGSQVQFDKTALLVRGIKF